MIGSAVSLNASSYSNLFAGNSGSLSIPVSPSAVGYAQFDHVHGVAALPGQSGVPLSRVKILDTLINQLVSLKNNPPVPSKEEIKGLDASQMDELIKNMQRQIKETVEKAAKNGNYGLTGALPEPGQIVSIQV